MPRTDDPTARSIFDLLEEKYPRESHPAPVAAPAAGRTTKPAPPKVTPIDGGSRSLLLASLVTLLATALVILSLKPDLPSKIVDTSPAIASRAATGPTSELGLEAPGAEPIRSPLAAEAGSPRPSTPEPATIATLTVARPPAEKRPAPPVVEQPTPRPAPAVPPAVATIAATDPSPDVRSTEVRQPPAAPVPAAPVPAAPVPAAPVPAAPVPAAPEAAEEMLAESTPRETEPVSVDGPERLPPAPTEAAEAVAAVKIDPPVRLVTPLPAYTQDAWVAGIQGDVLVRARIDKEGTVADVKVLRGLPHGLTEAAVAAVRRWRFRPANIDGEPVSADHDLSIRFTL